MSNTDDKYELICNPTDDYNNDLKNSLLVPMNRLKYSGKKYSFNDLKKNTIFIVIIIVFGSLLVIYMLSNGIQLLKRKYSVNKVK
jgi:hypothetical protein